MSVFDEVNNTFYVGFWLYEDSLFHLAYKRSKRLITTSIDHWKEETACGKIFRPSHRLEKDDGLEAYLRCPECERVGLMYLLAE